MEAVKVEGPVKRYGEFEALAGVDFALPPGSVFGLVGPNRAGKTTLKKHSRGRCVRRRAKRRYWI